MMTHNTQLTEPTALEIKAEDFYHLFLITIYEEILSNPQAQDVQDTIGELSDDDLIEMAKEPLKFEEKYKKGMLLLCERRSDFAKKQFLGSSLNDNQ